MQPVMKFYALICGLVVVLQFSNASGSEDILFDDDLSLSHKRGRRSALSTIRSILSSSWMRYKAGSFRNYQKKGNYKDAIKDFRRFNPTKVTREGPRTRGTAGDLLIELHRGERKRADLSITSKHLNKKNRITIEYLP